MRTIRRVSLISVIAFCICGCLELLQLSVSHDRRSQVCTCRLRRFQAVTRTDGINLKHIGFTQNPRNFVLFLTFSSLSQRLLFTMTITKNPPLPTIALPGQPLGPLSSYIPGSGTHIPPSVPTKTPAPTSIIHASILGPTDVTPKPPTASRQRPTLSISRHETEAQKTSQQRGASLLPKEGNVILGRVTRINIREARVQILVINDIPTMEEFTGVIRYGHLILWWGYGLTVQGTGCKGHGEGSSENLFKFSSGRYCKG